MNACVCTHASLDSHCVVVLTAICFMEVTARECDFILHDEFVI